jgi:hypothetical protein
MAWNVKAERLGRGNFTGGGSMVVRETAGKDRRHYNCIARGRDSMGREGGDREVRKKASERLLAVRRSQGGDQGRSGARL